MKKIILTGGGTAGHVTPNIALIPGLKRLGYDIKYIGSYDGIEKKLIEELGISYSGISSGKFRRYMSAKNLSDPFRVIKGYSEAKSIIKDYKPDIVFSKGGFVSVPVVLAARRYKVPVIIHESDMTPGLANKIAIPSATKVCHNFPETAEYLPKGKSVLTGSPIRTELLKGDKLNGLKMCDFTSGKPIIMVIGGSLGAVAVNNAVREALPELTADFQIVHLCGKGKTDESLNNKTGYKQFEYIKDELKDLFAMSDIIISRAGANAICEIAALKKPSILIPLSANASRGDQILNANSFKKQGFSEVIEEENLNKTLLIDTVHEVYENRSKYINKMEKSGSRNAVDTILKLIEKCEQHEKKI
ncbi:MAG: undecaprenyldiphospho-muramoylpentapeptide beta-N-acetylglucosaminyltransferase [Lachnospiraceae bacterium]|nr:undecaprenyldiphospho-muramoylpentapeptide beta-N-acetylglucosaminyltransferase [Lachnospiraceae bacterium]